MNRGIPAPSPLERPPHQPQPLNLASSSHSGKDSDKKKLKGTGGTSLIPFLKQARDETGEPAVDDWFRRTMTNGRLEGKTGPRPPLARNFASLDKIGERADGEMEIVGLSGLWKVDDCEGGICHW